jgi:endogenous inhibitor of DNA gyrase (YacG/DUF329 family)
MAMKQSDEIPTQDETVCPKCAGIATWGYLDLEQTRVQVSCADCGQVEMERAEFDVMEAELAGADEE